MIFTFLIFTINTLKIHSLLSAIIPICYYYSIPAPTCWNYNYDSSPFYNVPLVLSRGNLESSWSRANLKDTPEKEISAAGGGGSSHLYDSTFTRAPRARETDVRRVLYYYPRTCARAFMFYNWAMACFFFGERRRQLLTLVFWPYGCPRAR